MMHYQELPLECPDCTGLFTWAQIIASATSVPLSKQLPEAAAAEQPETALDVHAYYAALEDGQDMGEEGMCEFEDLNDDGQGFSDNSDTEEEDISAEMHNAQDVNCESGYNAIDDFGAYQEMDVVEETDLACVVSDYGERELTDDGVSMVEELDAGCVAMEEQSVCDVDETDGGSSISLLSVSDMDDVGIESHDLTMT